MPLEPGYPPEAQSPGLIRGDDEASPVEYNTSICQPVVGTKWNGGPHVGPDGQVGPELALALGEEHLRLVALAPGLAHHFAKRPRAGPGLRHGHGDAHVGAVAAVDPGVVGHGKDQGQGVLGLQVPPQHLAGKHLAQAVGGDEPEAAELAFPDQAGRVVPPVHHVVHRLGDVVVGGSQRLGVAVAKGLAHPPVADEGRVAHHEVGRRPVGAAGVDEAGRGDPGGLVGHLLAGHRVRPGGHAVPAGDGLAVLAPDRFDRVPREHGVAALDVAEVLQHRLGGHNAAAVAEVPLEVADP